MPKLGMSMKKGRVQHWLVAEGDPVEKGQPLFELHTDKVNALVDAPASGVLGRVVAGDGAELPVGGLLALIGQAGDTFPSVAEPGGVAEVTGLVARRAQLSPGFEAATGIHLTYTDLLIQEVAALMGEHGLLNSTLVDGSIVVSEQVHMGFAVALDDGLIVPVIRDAHT